jgi:hypothetical protein
VGKDVLQRNWFVRVFGASFMYLKFRCSRCKRLGERFIEQEKWDDSLLRDIPAEITIGEKREFERLGGISVDEQIQFHFSLDDPACLSLLNKEPQSQGGPVE